MLLQLTQNGLAALQGSPTVPLTLGIFKLGDAFNYSPSDTDPGLNGTLVFQGSVSKPIVVNSSLVKYVITLDETVPTISYGELGLFMQNGLMFAKGAWSSLQKHNGNNVPGVAPDTTVFDCYVPTTGTNYAVLAELGNSGNPMNLQAYSALDRLPNAVNAKPNVYMIPQPGGRTSAIAFSNNSLWSVTGYEGVIVQDKICVTGNTTFLTVDNNPLIPNPSYPGELLIQFTSGVNYGSLRVIKSIYTTAGSGQTITWDYPLTEILSAGDKFMVMKKSLFNDKTLGVLNGISPSLTSDILNKLVDNPPDMMLRIDGKNKAIANLDLGGFQFKNAKEATEDTDLVTLSQLKNFGQGGAGSLAALQAAVNELALRFLPLNGSKAMTGDLQLDGHQIRSVKAGTNPTDAVNVEQLDQALASFQTGNFLHLDANNNVGVRTDVPTQMMEAIADSSKDSFYAVTRGSKTMGSGYDKDGNALVGTLQDEDFSLATNKTPRLTVKKNTGYVGIGETSPDGPFSVNIKATNTPSWFGLIASDGSGVGTPGGGMRLSVKTQGKGVGWRWVAEDAAKDYVGLESFVLNNGSEIRGPYINSTGAVILPKGLTSNVLNSDASSIYFGLSKTGTAKSDGFHVVINDGDAATSEVIKLGRVSGRNTLRSSVSTGDAVADFSLQIGTSDTILVDKTYKTAFLNGNTPSPTVKPTSAAVTIYSDRNEVLRIVGQHGAAVEPGIHFVTKDNAARIGSYAAKTDTLDLVIRQNTSGRMLWITDKDGVQGVKILKNRMAVNKGYTQESDWKDKHLVVGGSAYCIPVTLSPTAGAATANLDDSNVFLLDGLTANCTLTFSGTKVDGQIITLRVGFTSAATVTFPADVRLKGTLNVTAGSVNWITLAWNSSANKFDGAITNIV